MNENHISYVHVTCTYETCIYLSAPLPSSNHARLSAYAYRTDPSCRKSYIVKKKQFGLIGSTPLPRIPKLANLSGNLSSSR